MAYPVFPTIQKYSVNEDITPEDAGISTDYEDGSQSSRARFTRSRLTYARKWNAMPEADWQTLLNFYRNTARGCSQICTWNGVNGRLYELKGQRIGAGKYAVSVVFKEA
jgi:hypothetical protein